MISLFLHFLFFLLENFCAMNGWPSTRLWFCLQFLVHLQKRQCESELHQTKQKTFYLVEIKASELADFPGVNTPYMKTELFFFYYII